MSFKTTPAHQVLVSQLREVIINLQPGEALPWQALPFVPKGRRAYWAKQAFKAAGVQGDWDKTGILRCHPENETTLRRARKHAAGLRNKARRTQRAYEDAAETLAPSAPTALHLESANGAGVAGSIFGMCNAKPVKVSGNARPALPIVKT